MTAIWTPLGHFAMPLDVKEAQVSGAGVTVLWLCLFVEFCSYEMKIRRLRFPGQSSAFEVFFFFFLKISVAIGVNKGNAKSMLSW